VITEKSDACAVGEGADEGLAGGASTQVSEVEASTGYAAADSDLMKDRLGSAKPSAGEGEDGYRIKLGFRLCLPESRRLWRTSRR
jgi:hypothetical protein